MPRNAQAEDARNGSRRSLRIEKLLMRMEREGVLRVDSLTKATTRYLPYMGLSKGYGLSFRGYIST